MTAKYAFDVNQNILLHCAKGKNRAEPKRKRNRKPRVGIGFVLQEGKESTEKRYDTRKNKEQARAIARSPFYYLKRLGVR